MDTAPMSIEIPWNNVNRSPLSGHRRWRVNCHYMTSPCVHLRSTSMPCRILSLSSPSEYQSMLHLMFTDSNSSKMVITWNSILAQILQFFIFWQFCTYVFLFELWMVQCSVFVIYFWKS